MIRHKIINGICYCYKVTEESLGRCEEHNEPKKKPILQAKNMRGDTP